jgi:hypothetical protein
MVEKSYRAAPESGFPKPMISCLTPYRSPIDGKEITSWRQRDRDLKDNNAYDPRDGRYERPKPRQLDLFAPRD